MLQRRRERLERERQRDASLQRMYRVPDQFMTEQDRRRFFHEDLCYMEPWQLEIERQAVSERIWQQGITVYPWGEIGGTGPHREWLLERRERITALLSGKQPQACPHCGQPPRQPRLTSAKPAGRVELHFTDRRAE